MSAVKIDSFRDLRVWKEAMDAAEAVLEVCDAEPLSRKLRFASQFEASAISVPANVAEGHAGGSTKVYVKHLHIARGSLAETLTYLELAARRGYITRPQVTAIWNKLQHTGLMLNALLSVLKKKLAFKKNP
ncbi:MAG: four helix bundle protein [Planctomycetes bacterium]|nr:four helix bundle protein [Planctomycetota bacterium]